MGQRRGAGWCPCRDRFYGASLVVTDRMVTTLITSGKVDALAGTWPHPFMPRQVCPGTYHSAPGGGLKCVLGVVVESIIIFIALSTIWVD